MPSLRVVALLAAFAALIAAGCGGGGGSSGGAAAGASVSTYGNTTLPGRLLVNSGGGSGTRAVFDLRTAQRVVPPPSRLNPQRDWWSAGASATTPLLRWNEGATLSEIAFFDPTAYTSAKPSVQISNTINTPLLSADGRYLLAFWYDQSSGEFITDKLLTVFDSGSGAVVKRGSQLDDKSVISRPAAWLPDGRYVYLAGKSLYASSPASTVSTLIAALALPDNASPNVSRSAMAVSPDGKRLAFSWTETRGLSQDSNLWVVGADGTGLRRLTSAPDPKSALDFVHGSPTWSPDGQWIAGVLYMGGTSVAPVFPDEPFAGSKIVSTTGCIDQVFVLGAGGGSVALTWPTYDAAHGVKVEAPSGGGGQWLSTCGGEIFWLP